MRFWRNLVPTKPLSLPFELGLVVLLTILIWLLQKIEKLSKPSPMLSCHWLELMYTNFIWCFFIGYPGLRESRGVAFERSCFQSPMSLPGRWTDEPAPTPPPPKPVQKQTRQFQKPNYADPAVTQFCNEHFKELDDLQNIDQL